jgi:hypothetical protein
MPNPGLSPEQVQEAVEALALHGSQAAAARALGLDRSTYRNRLEKARTIDPAIQEGMDAIGTKLEPSVAWVKTDKAGNVSYSLQLKAPSAEVDFAEVVRETLDSYKPLDRKLFAPRVNTGAKGEHLLVVDLADVHFGKLCLTSETNHEYNIEAARHRTIEGTRALLQASSGLGIARILFVMGNDILHTECGKATTSGTPQDTDQSFFAAVKAAEHASIDAVAECAAVADVDLLHCMSNHDRRSGWILSQTIAAALRGHDGVRATDYNMSARKYKFYGYENNGFLLTHGDKLKEEMIAGLFLKEGTMLAGCNHRYALVHDKHHKMVRRRGVDVFESEKDHNSVTVISSGAPNPENSHIQVEYVRSPSAPDLWHADNLYLNRQAVECFGYHPYDGQKFRYTEWF